MQSGVSSISTSHTNSGVHGRAKAMDLSLVREVLSLPMHRLCALSKWVVKIQARDISFADACRAAAKEWREKRIIEGRFVGRPKLPPQVNVKLGWTNSGAKCCTALVEKS